MVDKFGENFWQDLLKISELNKRIKDRYAQASLEVLRHCVFEVANKLDHTLDLLRGGGE